MNVQNVSDFRMPSYLEFIYGVGTAYSESWQLMTWDDVSPKGWMSTLEKANYSYFDIVYVFLCAIMWTLLRLFCNKAIFEVNITLQYTAVLATTVSIA